MTQANHSSFLGLSRSEWNPLSKTVSSLFLLVESFSKISELIARQNSLFLPSCIDLSWKCAWNLLICQQYVDKSDTPKNSKLAKISSLQIMFKKPYLSQYFMDSSNWGLKI